MWVRSKYANELAALSAWLSIFIPWNVTRYSEASGQGDQITALFFRFPFLELQFRNNTVITETSGPAIGVTYELPGAASARNLYGDVYITWPIAAIRSFDSTLQQASLLWTGAAIMFGLALALSIALYLREEEVAERLPILPARLMGVLLGLGALGTSGASVLYYTERAVVGFTIPVGVIVIALLALMLLRTKPVPAEDDDQAAETELDSS